MDFYKKYGIKLTASLFLAAVSLILINLHANIIGFFKGFSLTMHMYTSWVQDHKLVAFIVLLLIWYAFIWLITRKRP